MKWPTIAPRSCAEINTGTDAIAIPEKESVSDRPKVIAGLAKLVEEVKM
jgi:hypothetical protein